MLRTRTLARLITTNTRSFSNGSTVPTVHIKIHHEQSSSSSTTPTTPLPTHTLDFQITPQWSETYELISVEGDGTNVTTTGNIDATERHLKLDVHVPADARESSINLALPQRCHVTMMGSRTTNLLHQINVGGGSGHLEGDLTVYIPNGDIHVQKARGEHIELRTAKGGVHIKSVLEGLNADISSTTGCTAKRIMGENVTVRVSGGRVDGGNAGQGGNDGTNNIHIAAMYGGQFFLQSPQGSVNVETAQVHTLDVRSGGKDGIRVGGMSGNIVAYAMNGDTIDNQGRAPMAKEGTADGVADLHVNFDQLVPATSPRSPNKTYGDGDGDDAASDSAPPVQDRSLLRADGNVYVALNDETPFAVQVDLKSQSNGIVLPLDYSATGAPALGRQAQVSKAKTALFEPIEDTALLNEGRMIGLLRSAPVKKSRASNSGGSGKINMAGGNDLMGLSGEDKNGALTVMAEGVVEVAIHGWMDRIKQKYLGREEEE